jgi:haloalkane dehalogenase
MQSYGNSAPRKPFDGATPSRDLLRPFDVPQELFPVQHRFLELDCARIHYVDEGAGESLLLLHGNPSWCFLYRKIIAALRSDFRCVALDFPGYGMSDAPAGYGFTPKEHSDVLEHFVDRLGLKDLTMMVQDWGGPIGRLLTSTFNFVPKFFFTRGLAQRPAPEVLEMYLAPWRNPARRTAAVIAPRQLVAASPYLREVAGNLPKLADRPVLIVWGMKDFAFREAERQRFERIFSKHKTVLFDDASHFLQEDVGDRISESIRAFRREVTDPGADYAPS